MQCVKWVGRIYICLTTFLTVEIIALDLEQFCPSLYVCVCVTVFVCYIFTILVFPTTRL